MIPLVLAAVVSLSNPALNAIVTLEIEASGGGPARTIEVRTAQRQLPLAIFPDGQSRTYSLLLAHVPAGTFEVTVSGATLRRAAIRASDQLAVRHAPFLSPRAGTIEARSDLPLMMYCEELTEAGARVLQYTVIFSNEDGGTSTRKLMARWGRTSDIEYIYRVFLDGNGAAIRRSYQGKDHVETPFDGPFDGDHALLSVATLNNMVIPGAVDPRFQLAPQPVSLQGRSRESVMDGAPWVHQAAAAELPSENKLRPYGRIEGERISDLRNYLFVDFAMMRSEGAAILVHVRRKDDKVGYSSHMGRLDAVIDRNGHVRTAVELPPGTQLQQIEAVGFECVLVPVKGKLPESGQCEIHGIAKAFFLNERYVPASAFFKSAARGRISAGQTFYIAP